jgi:site-specific recombinase XerD
MLRRGARRSAVRSIVSYSALTRAKPLADARLQQGMATVQVDGYDIRKSKKLLGHRDVSTTMIYTYVPNRGRQGIQSPIGVS